MSKELLESISEKDHVEAGREFERIMTEKAVNALEKLRLEVAEGFSPLEEKKKDDVCEGDDCDCDEDEDDKDVKESTDKDADDKHVEEASDEDKEDKADDEDVKEAKEEDDKDKSDEEAVEEAIQDKFKPEVIKEDAEPAPTYRVAYKGTNGRQGTLVVEATDLKEAHAKGMKALNGSKRTSNVRYRIVSAVKQK